MVRSTRFLGMRRYAKSVVVLGLGLALTTVMVRPIYAGDGGEVAAGFIGGTALGLLAFGAAGAYGPPPPPYDVEPVEVAPGGLGPPPCHEVVVERFDPYAQSYVETPRRVCNAY